MTGRACGPLRAEREVRALPSSWWAWAEIQYPLACNEASPDGA